MTRSGPGAGGGAARVTRIPSGHPEGYLEGFANIYTEAAAAINAKKSGARVDPNVLYPTVHDGVKGVAFVEACVASSRRNGAWVEVCRSLWFGAVPVAMAAVSQHHQPALTRFGVSALTRRTR